MSENSRDQVATDCERLCTAFSYHLDHGDFLALAALFAPDGAFVRNGERLVGHEAILSVYQNRPEVTIMHLTSNFHLLDFNGRTARGRIYNMVIHALGTSDGPMPFDPGAAMRLIEFHDEFVLTEDGWRFASRDARPVMQSKGWPG